MSLDCSSSSIVMQTIPTLSIFLINIITKCPQNIMKHNKNLCDGNIGVEMEPESVQNAVNAIISNIILRKVLFYFNVIFLKLPIYCCFEVGYNCIH